SRRTRLEVEALESRVVPAIHIEFKYSFDFSGWFRDPTLVTVNGIRQTLGQVRQDVLQQAANDITDRLSDFLDAIPAPPDPANDRWTTTFRNPGYDPNSPIPEASQRDITLDNFQVPANWIIIFVAGQPKEPGATEAAGASPGLARVASLGDSQ